MKRLAMALATVAFSVLLMPTLNEKHTPLENTVQTAPEVQTIPPVQEPVVSQTETVTEPPQEFARYGCDLAYAYDWPADIAHAVCMAESGANQDATNHQDNHGSCIGSYSLMQVGCFWYYHFGYTDSDFYNPVVNMEIAYKIWQRQGSFRAWSAYNNGAYLRHL